MIILFLAYKMCYIEQFICQFAKPYRYYFC